MRLSEVVTVMLEVLVEVLTPAEFDVEPRELSEVEDVAVLVNVVELSPSTAVNELVVESVGDAVENVVFRNARALKGPERY